MKALNQKNIAECSKICVKTLKSWTRQFSHASGFLLFMVLRLCFLENWAECFLVRYVYSSWCALSQQQHSLGKSGRGEAMHCDVLAGVGLCKRKQKKLLICLAHNQNSASSLPLSSSFSCSVCSQILCYVPTSVHVSSFSVVI